MPKRVLFTGSFLVAAATFSQLSMAQDEDFDLSELAIEEIIVTAQKKSESIQDVPVSMTAMGAEALEASGTTHFKDLAQMTPGLFIEARGGTGFGTQIRIRGIGTPPFNATLPPAVGIFIDDVAQGTLGAALAELPDVERVEILRGPQGTLYGKNVPAGAISYITKRPENDVLEGKIEGTVGNYNHGSVKGSVNVPVIEDLLGVRISAYHSETDGFQDVFLAQDSSDPQQWKKTEAPNTNSTGGRMRIGYAPTSEFEAILTLESFTNKYSDAREVVEYSTTGEKWRQMQKWHLAAWGASSPRPHRR